MVKKIMLWCLIASIQTVLWADPDDGAITLFWNKIAEKEKVLFNTHLSTDDDWKEAQGLLGNIRSGLAFFVYDLVNDGKKDLIVSAMCRKDLFDVVRKIVSKAPSLKLLKPVALFPKMTKFVPLTVDDKPLAIADIQFDYTKLESGKYDVMFILPSDHMSVLIDAPTDDYYGAYMKVFYLMTMQVLGERLMSDKIDAIDMYRDRVPEPGIPFVKLPDIVK